MASVYFTCDKCGGPAEFPLLNDGLCNQCAMAQEGLPSLEDAYMKVVQDSLQSNKVFWIVWSPQGDTNPSYRHPTHQDALAEAHRLANAHPGQDFYVARIEKSVRYKAPCQVVAYN